MRERARYLRPGAVFAGVVLAWIAVTAGHLVSALILPPPMAVMKAMIAMTEDGSLPQAVAATLGRVTMSLVVALIVGVPAGLLCGYSSRLSDYLTGPLNALRSVPATALFPLLLVVVGVGDGAIIALSAYPSTLIVMVNALTGVRFANPRRIHHARSLGLTDRQLVFEVLIYEAMPGIIHGLRVAISYSLALVIGVEMFLGVSRTGLGRLIYDHQVTYDTPSTYAAIVVAGLSGIALNGVLAVVERRALRWLPTASADGTGLI